MGMFFEKRAPAPPFGARGFALCRGHAVAEVYAFSGPAVLGGAARPPRRHSTCFSSCDRILPPPPPPPRRSAHHCCAWIKPRFALRGRRRGRKGCAPTLRPCGSLDFLIDLPAPGPAGVGKPKAPGAEPVPRAGFKIPDARINPQARGFRSHRHEPSHC